MLTTITASGRFSSASADEIKKAIGSSARNGTRTSTRAASRQRRSSSRSPRPSSPLRPQKRQLYDEFGADAEKMASTKRRQRLPRLSQQPSGQPRLAFVPRASARRRPGGPLRELVWAHGTAGRAAPLRRAARTSPRACRWGSPSVQGQERADGDRPSHCACAGARATQPPEQVLHLSRTAARGEAWPASNDGACPTCEGHRKTATRAAIARGPGRSKRPPAHGEDSPRVQTAHRSAGGPGRRGPEALLRATCHRDRGDPPPLSARRR